MLLLMWGSYLPLSPAQGNCSIKNFSTREGLPHSTVFRICQAHEGAPIWFGTDLGLSSYDGNTFQKFIFSHPVNLNYVLTIKPYGRDTLIISYYKEGLFFFHQGVLEPIGPPESKVKRAISVSVDEDRRIWALENSIISVWDQKDWRTFLEFEDYGYTAICEAPRGGILIGTENGLLWHRKDTAVWIQPQIKNIWKEGLVTDDQGNIWVAADQAIYRIDPQQHLTKWMDLPDEMSQKIVLKATEKGLWGALEQGSLFLYQNGALQTIQVEGQEIAKVTDIETDHEGNIWVSTSGEGVYQIALAEACTLVDKNIPVNRILVLGEKDLLLGGIGTLYRWKDEALQILNENFTILEPGELLLSHYRLPESKRTIMGTNLQILSCDDWDDPNPQQYLARSISTWVKVPDGGFVIGSYEDLVYTNDQLESQDSLILDAAINTMFIDPQSTLWIGTSAGLYRCPSSDIRQISKVSSLAEVQIRDIVQDRKGRLWLATSTGAACLEQGVWQYFSFRERDVLSRCNVVVEDAQERIWMGTSNGLFYSQRDTFRKYFPFNLFLKEEILSLQIDEEERLWVGTSSGVVYIDLDRVAKTTSNILPPPVQITAVTTQDHRYLGASPIQIPYTENRLTIDFTAIGFRYHDQINFQYRLVDRDDRWHSTFADHIVYEQLPPGAYTFALKANYHYSEMTSQPVYFSFQVIPPFWQRYWFIALSVVLILGLGYWSIAAYIQKVKDREKQKREAQAAQFATEKKIEQLRQEALNAMMNPHFISNALGSIRHYLQSHTTLETDQLITDFADLIRLNLKYSRATYIPLEVAIHRLQYYLSIEQYRFDHQFQYEFIIDEEVEVDEIEIPNMVVQPFVENAIWWGILPQKNQMGKIELHFHLLQEDLLEIKIIDNGIGFSKSKKQNRRSKSMGIDLIKKRLALCDQLHPIAIHDIYGEAPDSTSGTCVLLKLKV